MEATSNQKETHRTPHWLTKEFFLPLLVGVLVGVITTLFSTYMRDDRDRPTPHTAFTTSIVTTQPPSIAPPLATATPTNNNPGTPASPPTTNDITPTPNSQQKNFKEHAPTLDNAAATEWCRWPGNTGYSWRRLESTKNPATITQNHYRRGFFCNMLKNYASGYVDILVPKGASDFMVTSGQLDSSTMTDGSVVFEILNASTGQILESRTLRHSESVDFKVAVDGVIRIRLQVTAQSDTGKVDLYAAWAEPTFK